MTLNKNNYWSISFDFIYLIAVLIIMFNLIRSTLKVYVLIEYYRIDIYKALCLNFNITI